MKKRASERIEVLNTESGQTLFDLSTGGMCCFYQSKKKPGEEVTVTIEDLTLAARVAYCSERTDGSRLGLQFWEVPQDKKSTLNKLVDDFSRGVPLKCSVTESAKTKK